LRPLAPFVLSVFCPCMLEVVMKEVYFNGRSTARRGSAQVCLPGRGRRAVVRWDGDAVSVCLPNATEWERREAIAHVTEARFWRRVT
jgi:hypothetical protein